MCWRAANVYALCSIIETEGWGNLEWKTASGKKGRSFIQKLLHAFYF